MDRTERFYKIERMLRNREVVPIRDFLDELGVSVPPSSAISNTCTSG
jgi:predicted DNA-binding transcriptional regulator YafY